MGELLFHLCISRVADSSKMHIHTDKHTHPPLLDVTAEVD